MNNKQIYGKKFSDFGSEVVGMVLCALRAAEDKHPGWPEDKIHSVGIVVEEAGEAMQAANDYVYHGGDIERIREELVQTAASAIRALIHLPAVDRW